MLGVRSDQGHIEFECGRSDKGIGEAQAVGVRPGVDEVSGKLADGRGDRDDLGIA